MKEHDELLKAAFQLLHKQDKSNYVLNIHSQLVFIDDGCEVDGMSLQDQIKDYLEGNDINPYELDNDEVHY